MTDVVIIGGGVTGCSIARYLSMYDLDVMLVEKHSDICEETSKANSGIVHAGHDPIPGTLKAQLNIEGNRLLRELAPILGFDLWNNGAMVLCFDEEDRYRLEELYERGLANGVPGMRILSHDEAVGIEPNLNQNVVCALHLPTSSVVCPFSLTIAMAENARTNGVEFRLSTRVEKVVKTSSGFMVFTDRGNIETRCVVNAAGLYADVINNMINDRKIKIRARKGEYVLLDRSEGNLVRSTLFQLPTDRGKGVLVTPTFHRNILVGPDAQYIDDKDDTSTTRESLDYVMSQASGSVARINYRKVITSFSGLRASLENSGDFIIESAVNEKFFITVAGIDSPGLTCSAAIGKKVSEMVKELFDAKMKDDFIAERKPIPKVNSLPLEERNALIRKNPRYGNIICRCEQISEGEICDAIHSNIPALTLDGVKRRVRAQMGRCQGGFCTPKIMEIISRETGIRLEDVRKNDEGSEVLK